jgi:hypothetical protein
MEEKDADSINQKYFRDKPKGKQARISKTHKAALAKRALSDKNAARFAEAMKFLNILRGKNDREN